MNKAAFRALFFIVFIGAILFRLAGLDLRPMHHDEANQAVKFGTLLEKGEYRYDKADHHGPSLYYLTLPVAWAFSKTSLASLDEVTLRLLPALFGAAILLLLLLLVKGMGRTAVFFASLFAAISPAMVYYSRFYIQEMLFVFFVLGLLGSLWRYLLYPSARWALTAGLFAGMMYATKETSVIIFAAVGLALILTIVFQKVRRQTPYRLAVPGFTYFFLGLVAAVLTAIAFFTSFFKNPEGIWDSITALKIYFEKSGAAGIHVALAVLFKTAGVFKIRHRPGVDRRPDPYPGPHRNDLRICPAKAKRDHAFSGTVYLFLYAHLYGCIFHHPLQDALEPAFLFHGMGPPGRNRRRISSRYRPQDLF